MSDDFDSAGGPVCAHAFVSPCGGGIHPALMILAIALLIGLGLVIGMAMQRHVEAEERRKAATAIYQAVYEEIAIALAAYGGATVPAAEKLAVTVRLALGPVLSLAGSLAGPLKQIDTAVKGKTKDKPTGGGHGGSGGSGGGGHQAASAGPVAQQQIIIHAATATGEVASAGGGGGGGHGGGSGSGHAETERDMTAAEQQDEARHGIEALAAIWVQRDVVPKLLDAQDALNHARVKPKLLGFGGTLTKR